jgi:hypothetical protein
MCRLENAATEDRICFNDIMGFQKLSTSLHTRFTAETLLADGEFLQVRENYYYYYYYYYYVRYFMSLVSQTT